jgi:hypothetical protein
MILYPGYCAGMLPLHHWTPTPHMIPRLILSEKKGKEQIMIITQL